MPCGITVLLLLLLLYMSIIMVALSHYCCRTTLQCQLQCYLPPARDDITTLNPAEAGTRLSDPGGMQG